MDSSKLLSKINSKITKTTPSKINSGEWLLVVLALVFIDVIQIILNFALGSGIVANRFIDIGVGLALALYLIIRGEFGDPETRLRIIFIVIATFTLEQIPLLDVAPFWTGDGLYLWHLSNKRNKKADESKEAEAVEEKQNKIQSQQLRISKIQQVREQQNSQREEQLEEQRRVSQSETEMQNMGEVDDDSELEEAA